MSSQLNQSPSNEQSINEEIESCFTCAVSWTNDQVTLDCSECGGYSLERPCPLCDGECGAMWKRELTMSHLCGKACWYGICNNSFGIGDEMFFN